MLSRFLPLFALLLALPLAACGSDEPEVEEVPEVTEVETVDPAPAVAEVDVPGTIAALEGGLTSIPAGAAVDNINGWIATLDGAGFEGAQEITDNLGALRDALQAETLDGAVIGATLTRLGELTTAAAAGASSSSQDGLTRLGTLLSEGGALLTGGA